MLQAQQGKTRSNTRTAQIGKKHSPIALPPKKQPKQVPGCCVTWGSGATASPSLYCPMRYASARTCVSPAATALHTICGRYKVGQKFTVARACGTYAIMLACTCGSVPKKAFHTQAHSSVTLPCSTAPRMCGNAVKQPCITHKLASRPPLVCLTVRRHVCLPLCMIRCLKLRDVLYCTALQCNRSTAMQCNSCTAGSYLAHGSHNGGS